MTACGRKQAPNSANDVIETIEDTTVAPDTTDRDVIAPKSIDTTATTAKASIDTCHHDKATPPPTHHSSTQTDTPKARTTEETSTTAATTEKTISEERSSKPIASFPIVHKSISIGTRTYDVADISDRRTVYKNRGTDNTRCFFVISKQEYRLYVYEQTDTDTLLVAHYPICYAKRSGQKTKDYDMCTPEGDMDNAFSICQISRCTTWQHDFGDGRGKIRSYGNWFLRLDLSQASCLNSTTRANRTIGIHGSTNNRESVPGNDSEGCVRLRDEDLDHLKAHYATIGTKVVIKPSSQGKYDFERRAQQALGNRYVHAREGYRL